MASYTLQLDDKFEHGRYGIVYKATRESDKQVFACKLIQFSGEKQKAKVVEEGEILKSLQHRNIVEYVEVVLRENSLQLFMTWYDGGTLRDLITKRQSPDASGLISEDYIWCILFQLSAALLFCHDGLVVDENGNIASTRAHSRTVLHRDIKPANVLRATDSETALDAIKLCDFGLAASLEDADPAPSTYVGTPQYMAPEIRYKPGKSIQWDKRCDIFSLGCTIYYLCAYKAPFLWRMEDEKSPHDPIPTVYSKELNHCIDTCLSYKPKGRPDARKLVTTAHQQLTARALERAKALEQGQNSLLTKNRVPNAIRTYTPYMSLFQVLSRSTSHPYGLSDFYIYMRDTMQSIDYLDFWLDVTQHTSLCRAYVRGLRRNILVATPDDFVTEREGREEILDTEDIEDNLDDTIKSPIPISPTVASSTSNLPRGIFSRPPTRPSTQQPPLTIARSDIRASAEKILYTYILPGSEREIVIPAAIMDGMQSSIEEEGRDDPEVFDAAKDYVFAAMERDAFPGFMKRRRAFWYSLKSGSIFSLKFYRARRPL